MTEITVGIIFGGSSPEHHESIRAARILYQHAIRGKLDQKYNFLYFHLTRSNRWASSKYSKAVIQKRGGDHSDSGYDRILDLKECDVLYSSMMGPCGENGNVMGLADLLNIPIIGCGILASALALDKFLSKLLAEKIGVPVVDYLQADRDDDPDELIKSIEEGIGFPCFVKPTNLGTCAHIFRADNREEFRKKWRQTTRYNHYSRKYLIEKFIPNVEVRVFVYEDRDGHLQTNDQYNTTLIEKALIKGGGLFDHVENKFSEETRALIRKYAKRIFRVFGMKDYSRIDFFVENETGQVYFNEANTQPFISGYNIKLMENDGYSYSDFLHSLVKKNLRKD